MAQAPIELDAALTELSAQAPTQAAQLAVRQTLGPLLPTTTPSRQPPQRAKICNRCRKRLWDQRLDFAVKIFGILAFLLSCAALCPSICGQEDAHRATQLAESSALKDFMAYCESHGWETSGCDDIRNVTLPPPPDGYGHLRRRDRLLEDELRILIP